MLLNTGQELRVLDERIQAEEVELLEKTKKMKESSKEKRKTTVRKHGCCRGWGYSERSSWVAKLRSGGLFVSEVGVHQKDKGRRQKLVGHVRATLQKKEHFSGLCVCALVDQSLGTEC